MELCAFLKQEAEGVIENALGTLLPLLSSSDFTIIGCVSSTITFKTLKMSIFVSVKTSAVETSTSYVDRRA